MLLTYKPLWINLKDMTLHPWLLPDVVMPCNRIVTSPCQHHNEPQAGCTCGVLSTVDRYAVKEFIKSAPIPKLINGQDATWKNYRQLQDNTQNSISTASTDVVPIMGVIQALGTTVREGNTLRSWGAFMWGIINPAGTTRYLLSPLYAKERLVIYYDLYDSLGMVAPTWEQYNITNEETK